MEEHFYQLEQSEVDYIRERYSHYYDWCTKHNLDPELDSTWTTYSQYPESVCEECENDDVPF
jgi:hypothetical protein